MKKLSLILAGIVGTLIVVALMAPLFIEPNEFRASISQQISKATGYNVALDGDLSIRLLPSARITAKDVTLASPQASSPEPFARITSLEVGIKLLPLLQGDIEIDELILENPVLTLVKQGGENNWQPSSAAIASPASSAPEEDASVKDEQQTARKLILSEVRIKGGSLTYKDITANRMMTLSDLDLKAGMDSMASSFDLNLQAKWNNKPLTLSAKLGSLSALLMDDPMPGTVSFKSDDLTARIEGVISVKRFKGEVEINSPSILAASSWLTGQKQQADMQVVKVNIQGQASCDVTECQISDGNYNIDDTKLQGNVVIEMDKPVLTVMANMRTDALDVSRYMNKKTAYKLNLISSAVAADPRWSRTPIDLSWLGAMNATLDLDAASFTANRFTMKRAVLHAVMNGGVLKAKISSGDVYDGAGDVTFDLSGSGDMKATADLRQLSVHPLLEALANYDRLSGKATYSTTISGRLNSVQTLVDTLTGKGEFNIQNGSVRGVDIPGMLRNTKAAFGKADGSQKTTDFSEMAASYTIENGVIRNDDLSMKAPLFRVAGAGKVDLPAYTANYRLDPQLVKSLEGQGGNQAKGVGVPILITGSLDNLTYAPDLSGVVNKAIKDPVKFRENVKESVKDVKEMFKDEEGMKDLLKDGKALLKGL